MSQETEKENSASLSQQIDDFVENGRYFLFRSRDRTPDLEKILLPAGFKQENPEHSGSFYLRQNKDSTADLFSTKNLFEDLFEANTYTHPIDWKEPEKHYLTLTNLANAGEADQLICKYHHLHYLWNKEGMTHRGFGYAEIIKPYWKNPSVKLNGIFPVIISLILTIPSIIPHTMAQNNPNVLRNIEIIDSTILLAGLVTGGVLGYRACHHLAKIDQTRQELKSQYVEELKQFREKYESRTVFDQTALENAVGFNRDRQIKLF